MMLELMLGSLLAAFTVWYVLQPLFRSVAPPDRPDDEARTGIAP